MPSSDSKCNNSGDASALTKEQMGTSSNRVAFNTNYNSLADVGYMYNTRYESNDLLKPSKVKYGNSFIWDGTNYTLQDTKEDAIFDTSAFSYYHYTCFDRSGICEELNYVHFMTSDYVIYIKLSNGKDIEDALNEMLYNEEVNTNDSTVKSVIDYWYSNNMTIYTNYLEDTVWCNDRSIANDEAHSWYLNGGSFLEWLEFNSKINTNHLICSNKNDRFSVNKETGNGALRYPVGLITRQEQSLAYNGNSPLASGKSYWIHSPIDFSYNGFVYSVGSHGNFFEYNNLLDTTLGVRPSISLRTGIEYMSGDGSSDTLYIIDMDS